MTFASRPSGSLGSFERASDQSPKLRLGSAPCWTRSSELPWNTKSRVSLDRAPRGEVCRDADHHGLEDVKIGSVEYLATRPPRGACGLEVIGGGGSGADAPSARLGRATPCSVNRLCGHGCNRGASPSAAYATRRRSGYVVRSQEARRRRCGAITEAG